MVIFVFKTLVSGLVDLCSDFEEEIDYDKGGHQG